MGNLNKVKTILSRFPYKLSCEEKDNVIFINGEIESNSKLPLDLYEEKYEIGAAVAKKCCFEHVVNNIVVKGLELPKIKENKNYKKFEISENHPDVLVIGGGVIGCAILRELSKYNLKSILVEKESDVALHASSRNDGNIHPGIDLHKETLKLKYLTEARPMWENFCKELDVKLVKTGQILAFTKNKLIIDAYVKIKEIKNKIPNVKFLNQKQIREIEPNISKDVIGACLFPEAWQVSPYELTIALAENAITNGAKVYLNTLVKNINVENGEIKSVETTNGMIYPKVVINAAGVFSEDIAKMANDHFFSIHPRKGTDLILDKKLFSKYAFHTIGIKGIEDTKSKTKGGGVIVTCDENYLLGPDAKEVPYKEDFSSSIDSINLIINKQKRSFPNISTRDVITYFSGVRACTYEEDFVIQKGKWTKNIVHAAGIQSPGLSCAPSIAKNVVEMTLSLFPNISKNSTFNPNRKGIIKFNELSLEEKDKLIKENPNYGSIICRCEKISKQEIIDAVTRPLEVDSIDAIKRRVRAGMGRCQGTFCEPEIVKIISEIKNCEVTSIKKKGDALVLKSEIKAEN